jgi:hypothetical protein
MGLTSCAYREAEKDPSKKHALKAAVRKAMGLWRLICAILPLERILIRTYWENQGKKSLKPTYKTIPPGPIEYFGSMVLT